MTPAQFALVLDAGRRAIPNGGATPAKVMDAVLRAMADACDAIESDEDTPNRAIPPMVSGTLPRDMPPTMPLFD